MAIYHFRTGSKTSPPVVSNLMQNPRKPKLPDFPCQKPTVARAKQDKAHAWKRVKEKWRWNKNYLTSGKTLPGPLKTSKGWARVFIQMIPRALPFSSSSGQSYTICFASSRFISHLWNQAIVQLTALYFTTFHHGGKWALLQGSRWPHPHPCSPVTLRLKGTSELNVPHWQGCSMVLAAFSLAA